MSEARIELAIFGFVDRRNIHYATRPYCAARQIISGLRVQKNILKKLCETLNFSFFSVQCLYNRYEKYLYMCGAHESDSHQ